MKDLKNAAESFLGHEISTALAATPNLIACYREDVNDAFEYLGIKSLENPNNLYRMFRETNAAVASYGIGLCHNWVDDEACSKEVKEMDWADILTVLYTKDALCVETVLIKSAYAYWPRRVLPPTMDFHLGSNVIDEDPDDCTYWSRVNDTVYRGLMGGYIFGHHVHKVFIYGESSYKPKFRQVLEDTVLSIQGTIPELYDEYQEYAPARGAAVFAMRGGYFRG